MPAVKKERSGWRDLGLNDRHRQWGWDCPAFDLDFVEYDNGKAVALVEYKSETAPLVFPKESANVRALVDLGNRAGVPVFGVRYACDFSWFNVVALNQLAYERMDHCRRKRMSEREYVGFLYMLRGRRLPNNLTLL